MNLKNIFKKKKPKEKKKKTLEKEIYDAGSLPNMVTGFLTILYIFLSTRISATQILPLALSGMATAGILQLLVAPITNKLITQSLSDDMDSFYNFDTTEKERTKLLKSIMAMPEKIGIEVFVVFMAGVTIWLACIAKALKLSGDTVLMFALSAFLGAYTGAVFAIGQTQKVCSKHAFDIVAKGVNRKEVEEKHSFGIASVKITVLHILCPILIINAFYFIITWHAFAHYTATRILISRIVSITVVNTIFYAVLSTQLFLRMMHSIHGMKKMLENMNRDNLEAIEPAPTDLSNEFMYNMNLINMIIEVLQKILKMSSDISTEVIESSNELSVISKETAVTSLEQSSGVKELLSAMEESDSLARSISEKITEVSIVARKNTEDINNGFDILKDNMQKISEIKAANDITVEGIKALTEKISGISDIAAIINSIADQTNIVAFNAEIEASNAGDVGENFHNVANEIRRLTNNTIQSTNEIRDRIIEIQHASEKLLIASQNGSRKIADESTIITELNDNFESLKSSSESTDEASAEIKDIIEQQTVSFEQIVVTLRQIAQTTESFSDSTQKISKSAEHLVSISDKLKEIQSKSSDEIVEEAN
ncbi:MAG: hypothetical protein K6G52_00015 [Treponemataceae bacterium]|nr:hypothetical protein [Treponemataceae bacterium]